MDKEENGRCIDNIIAAVCRMITAKPETVPLDQVCRRPFYFSACRSISHMTSLQPDSLQVLPVVIQKLPLREDEEEYKTVYRVLRDLLRVRHHIVRTAI